MGKTTIRRLAVMAMLLVTATAAMAADCISKTQLIATRSIFPNRVAGPVAWSGSVLAVAKQETGSAKAIHVAMYGPTLDPFSSDIDIAASSRGGPLALLWNGSEFGLFYQGTDLRIRMQRIGLSGEPLGGPVVITPNHGVFTDDELHVIWDPTRGAYLMARTITQSGERGLWLEVLERDGRARADRQVELFPARGDANPRVAVTDNGTIGVFYKHGTTGQLTLLRIDRNETLHAAVPVSAPGLTFDVHARNNLFGIVRRQAFETNRTEIRWMALDHTGAVVTGDRQLVASRGRDVTPVSLRGNENEWALSYVDSPLGFDIDRGELRLHRFTTAGGTISNTLFSPETARFNALASDPFVWTGRSYVTSGEFAVSVSEGSDSYLISHCPIRAAAAASRNLVILYDPVQFSATVEGGSGPYRYQWDLGDRNFRSGSTVSHTYQHTGTYTAILTVTDAAGGQSVSTVTVRVVEGKKRAVRPR